MATIHVDGKEYEVNGADNLLEACLSLGLDVPYFCWHPALGSVGACRQCAVKQYSGPDDKRGRLVMSCMAPATDGTYISVEDEEAVAFRKSVNEWMMLNHPHDCPVCEEGGACHLQDMTVMTGHNTRKYRFTKRTHENQDLGPFISHEMNRCIACYRCVRYYKDYADGADLGVYGAHDNVYFGRVESGTLENEFSGNLVDVCPTGVFTDKTQSAHFNRKWDMQYAPSICHGCSLGCNISPAERYGELRRIENRYHGGINHYFLCDRGRFGYGYVNLPERPYKAYHRHESQLFELSAVEAVEKVADVLRRTKRVAGIGSPRASVESNFMLRELVGEEHYSSGIADREWQTLQKMTELLRQSGARTPTLREIENCDAIFVLGEDLTQTAARMALAVRQAVKGKARQKATELKVDVWQIAAIQNIGQNDRFPLYLTSVDSTRLDDVACLHYHGAYVDQARLGFAVAHLLDRNAPAVPYADDNLMSLAQKIADGLSHAKNPLIITGTTAETPALLDAAANVVRALKQQNANVSLSLVAAEANSVGSALIGGKTLDQMLTNLEQGHIDTLIVMENDLFRRAPASRVKAALAKVQQLIVLDHQPTELVSHADWVLPAATFAEADGTLINNEGRAQRFFQVFEPSFYDTSRSVKESWHWLHVLASLQIHRRMDWGDLDDIVTRCADTLPALRGMVDAAPNAKFRIKGLKLARSPHRYSGRTSMRADIDVSEPRTAQDSDSAFTFSMEGYSGSREAFQQVPFAWAPGWNSPSAWNKFQDEVGGHLRAGDPGTHLFDSTSAEIEEYRTTIPATYSPNGALQIVAYWQLFGSEELTQRSEVMQQRMAKPALYLSEDDVARLDLKDGMTVRFTWDGQAFELPLKVSHHLADGLVGLPLGITPFVPAMLADSIDALQEVRT
ncbi:NADH-quinone oxidoreductase subunit NuoG [Tolumonas lignilytica]|uniref:NADH-quinone oxidoreductase subunit NuoG n=1 Tax=Tolumonas lignilytica TaxID=1283284 RepID=UPI000466FB04|nr:NADH-quinone oxidoreductase subunit NuoG [Tolumonas lignilytica]